MKQGLCLVCARCCLHHALNLLPDLNYFTINHSNSDVWLAALYANCFSIHAFAWRKYSMVGLKIAKPAPDPACL